MQRKPTCLLCGWVFLRQKGLRRVPTADLKARVTREWLPGPIIYPRVMAHAEPTAECCHTCLKRPGDRTTLLPMDQFLLYLVAPVVNPDQRRHKRMRATLLRNALHNPYAIPPFLVERAREECDPILAWWHRNLKTPFFKHKHTARAVRLALRGE